MCPCTDLTHDDVRRLILAQTLQDHPRGDAGTALDARPLAAPPAVRRSTYYLLCALAAATIGTTTRAASSTNGCTPTSRRTAPIPSCPRMWGGLTTPDELRAIADAADKYDVPMVKVTGGQRIDLLGVKKEDLPGDVGRSERRRHGLRSRLCQGSAHGEDLRRHRILPLRHAGFDRAGRQAREERSGASGRRTSSSWACRGCPRNCAEATCKDFGIDLRRQRLRDSASAGPLVWRSRRPSRCARSRRRPRRWS